MHALVLTLLLLAHGAAPAAPSPRDAALASFRKKDYARACPLFAEAARAEPENGAIWADLGLCELRRGRKAASVRASLRAVVHGDERTRSNAYFNLGLAGVALPFPARGRCTIWQAPEALTCPQRVEACHLDGPGHGHKGLGSTSYAALARCGEGCPRSSVPVALPPDAPFLTFDDPGSFEKSAFLLLYDDVVQTAVADFEDDEGNTTTMYGTGLSIVTECSVIVLDPCRGRAGLSCTRSEEGANGPPERFGLEQAFRIP